jgi:hypothetical protein
MCPFEMFHLFVSTCAAPIHLQLVVVKSEGWGHSNGIELIDLSLPKTSSASLNFSGEIWIKQGVSAL